MLALVTFALSTLASAAPSGAGGCPDDFHEHSVEDHDEEHEGEHKHVGADFDFNGDGIICVKHAAGGKFMFTSIIMPTSINLVR
jgi:hypothetical protein